MRQFKVEEGDSVSEMKLKNETLAEKMKIILASIKSQMSVLGH